MRKIVVADGIEICIGEMTDDRHSPYATDNEIFVVVNGKIMDMYSKDTIAEWAVDDGKTIEQEYNEVIVGGFKNCKTIQDVLDMCEVYGYTVSKNIYDLIEDFCSSDAYSNEDVETMNKMSVQELEQVLRNCTFATFTKLGKYYALIYD